MMPDIFVNPPTSSPKEAGEKVAAPLRQFPLAALMVNPSGIRFQDQESQEEVVLLLRRHWVTNLPWIFIGALMLLIPPFASLLLPLVPALQISFSLLLAGEVFWYLLSFGYLFINFLIWYFNAHLVTNKKLVDIDFHSLTYKEVSSTQLERIQDVSFRVGGVIRHIFDYGDVLVQTAGTEPNFELNAVPRPAFVADKLTDLLPPGEGHV